MFSIYCKKLGCKIDQMKNSIQGFQFIIAVVNLQLESGNSTNGVFHFIPMFFLQASQENEQTTVMTFKSDQLGLTAKYRLIPIPYVLQKIENNKTLIT